MKHKALPRVRGLTLSRPSFYLCLGGLNATLLAVCDTAIRLEQAIAQNPNLVGSIYIPAIEYVATSLLILLGGVLAIEYVHRT